LNTREAKIPHWAMCIIVLWAERAYRRGFQQGIVAAKKFGAKSNDSKLTDWRFGKYSTSGRGGSPYDRIGSTVLERHTEVDGPRGARIGRDGDSKLAPWILTKRS
jgi:hypothetical protein